VIGTVSLIKSLGFALAKLRGDELGQAGISSDVLGLVEPASVETRG
jgi:hypothetical protein